MFFPEILSEKDFYYYSPFHFYKIYLLLLYSSDIKERLTTG